MLTVVASGTSSTTTRASWAGLFASVLPALEPCNNWPSADSFWIGARSNHTACLTPEHRLYMPEVDIDSHPPLAHLNSSWNESWNAWLDRFVPPSSVHDCRDARSLCPAAGGSLEHTCCSPGRNCPAKWSGPAATFETPATLIRLCSVAESVRIACSSPVSKKRLFCSVFLFSWLCFSCVIAV